MAVVQGIREKVHLPLYDSVSIEPRKQLVDVERSSTLRFFVNVQNKTKLETNLQSASLLPHYNTFEARAMRVVISDLPPQFPDAETDKVTVKDEGLGVTDDEGQSFDDAGAVIAGAGAGIGADIEIGLDKAMELLHEARTSDEKEGVLALDDDGVTVMNTAGNAELAEAVTDLVIDAGGAVRFTAKELESLIEDLEKRAPPRVQLRPHDGAGTVVGKLIYNTVTTFYVGEKVMISMPTWFFPGGAGEFSGTGKFTTNGEPSPLATFRFAEPIYIDRQQNFRVEIEIPESDVLKDLQKLYGPLSIWVVLDGYMTRGVQ